MGSCNTEVTTQGRDEGVHGFQITAGLKSERHDTTPVVPVAVGAVELKVGKGAGFEWNVRVCGIRLRLLLS